MLVTPRTYRLAQESDKGFRHDTPVQFHTLTGWYYNETEAHFRHATRMLLLHQTGKVNVGEVVRYTLTYTPSLDRILPSPPHLHVKIKNTSAIPLRAAYLHGPYTLYAATYPSTFDPNHKHENHATEGSPDFEPNLKAGGHWTSKLFIPEDIRQGAGGPKSRQSLEGRPRSFTWVIEVASQVLFSTTATVHYEILVGRDERSVDLGFSGLAASAHGAAGKLEDHQKSSRHSLGQAKGVYSKAVSLTVEDTECLWNSPELPSWDDGPSPKNQGDQGNESKDAKDERDAATDRKRKRKKVHLVVLTHGLHSNIGADMLYMKESIDASAKEAREAARKQRHRRREEKRQADVKNDIASSNVASTSTPELLLTHSPPPLAEDEDSDDDEEIIVRGFSGNAVKTERGIQYLGKRLAKYVLSLTYPDQPFLPVKSSISRSITRSFTGQKNVDPGKQPAHKGSSIHRDEEHRHGDLAYQITSISFIAHSLGGLVQTYAVAYINKHSPEFFDLIKPINFVALASPFLGLSNENPIYVKFALDFGLVGRTGQDLGLTWRAPAAVRSGWGAVISGLGKDTQKNNPNQPDPSSKPLLRILPTGPAHSALQKFRNRTVYSNVVNDGIVPLRTSCLLFLDWRGLDRVGKARREMGLVGTMAGWGWAELTGQNASSSRAKGFWADMFSDNDDSDTPRSEPVHEDGKDVPQPDQEATTEDNIKNSEVVGEPGKDQFLNKQLYQDEAYDRAKSKESSQQQPTNPWTSLLSMFKANESKAAHHHPPKNSRIYQRGQTMMSGSEDNASDQSTPESSVENSSTGRVRPVRGSSLYTTESGGDSVVGPPKTTVFEAAGDLLNPPLPPKEYLIDPASRPKTIFHDRVYHPDDIPPPPAKKPSLMRRSTSLDSISKSIRSSSKTSKMPDTSTPSNEGTPGSMKVEEKIARAYHHELSWRKVLVRLEPDAHNNIIVRRKFANAYGWPVVKHVCDTHFAYTAAALTEDKYESNKERAKPMEEGIGADGEAVTGQTEPPPQTSQKPLRANSADNEPNEGSRAFRPSTPVRPRTESELHESRDEITDLKSPASTSYSSSGKPHGLNRTDSGRWSDRFFEGSDDEDDLEIEAMAPRLKPSRANAPDPKAPRVADVLSSSPTEEKSLNLTPDQGETSEPVLDQATLAMTGLGIGANSSKTVQAGQPESHSSHLPVTE